MHISKIDKLFSDDELKLLKGCIDEIVIPLDINGEYIYDNDVENEICTISRYLGRLQTSGFGNKINDSIYDKAIEIAKNILGKDISLSSKTYVEYSNKYGTPNLPPHTDGDSTELIINFQLDSNTQWDLGIGTNVYSLTDNSALVFNGNHHVHWRTHKVFKDGEYVRMIFFRFKQESTTDKPYTRLSLDDEKYKDVNKFRDSL